MSTLFRYHSTYLVLMTVIGFLLVGCAGIPSHLETTGMSVEEVSKFGEASSQLVVQTFGGIFRDDQLQSRLDQLIVSLQQKNGGGGEPVQVQVLNDSIPRSYSVPGRIFLSRGLITILKENGMLAAAIGHELGHLQAGHWQRNLRDKPFAPIFLVPSVSGSELTSAEAVQRRAEAFVSFLLEDGFSFREEVEADTVGRKILTPAGFDPRFIFLFRDLLERDAINGKNRGWWRTHAGFRKQDGQGRLALQSVSGETPEFLNELLSMQAGYRLFDRAQMLEREGELVEAIPVYLEAATAAPEQSLILTGLGMAYLQVGDLTAAHLNLRRAIYKDGAYYRSRFGFGFLLEQQGKIEEAISQLQKSVRLLPTTKAIFLLARCYARQGEVERAATLYRQVVASRDGKLAKQARHALRTLESGQ